MKKIGIVGRGSIGVNMAFYMQSASDIQVTLLVRDSVNLSEVLSIMTSDGEKHLLICQQAHISRESLRDLDLIIMPVKQYQVETLLQTIAPLVNTHASLMLLHNGMGGIELAKKYLPDNPLLAATTTDGVYKTSPTAFIQSATGQLDIGPADPEQSTENGNEPDFNYIKQIHPNVHWRNDIIFALYQKLAVNAVINPLTALKNCKNGELINYSAEVNSVKQEVFDLYEFMNLPIDNHALSQLIDDVIQLTQQNYSSMQQDFQHGRETEVEGILGFLIEKGHETGMKMDFIQGLYTQIVESGGGRKQYPSL